uniref:Transmembrane protein n=1 Tax=Caenorhabditis tropicalis TaxID=1561998 RepID=A0A1I7T5T5_9PELO
MTAVKRGTWLFIIVLGVLTAITCEFTTQLTYLHVASHVAILSAAHFALVHPPEELLDGPGLTLFDLFTILYNSRQYGFVEYAAKRVAFFHVFVASYPAMISFYFVHGSLFMKGTGSRFPELLDHPWLWLTTLGCSVIGSIIYCIFIKDYEQWPIYQYYRDHPEALTEVQEVITSPETFRIKFSQRTLLLVTRDFFVYSSNWKFVAVRMADVRLQVDNTRMPNIPDENEGLRYILIKVSFRPAYIPPFTLSLRQDYYRQLNDILEVPIFVPPHINVPLTIMEELKEDFVQKISTNTRYTHRVKRTEKDPCFACGTEENIVKLEKSCTGQEPRAIFHNLGLRLTPPCESCSCTPLWCSGCIAQIFITKQNVDNVNRYEYDRGTAQCPTCRKNFCIRDVHFVDFDYIVEETD